jgi:methylphosphotriester-DNA--protein-cysteine methyltransferase
MTLLSKKRATEKQNEEKQAEQLLSQFLAYVSDKSTVITLSDFYETYSYTAKSLRHICYKAFRLSPIKYWTL